MEKQSDIRQPPRPARGRRLPVAALAAALVLAVLWPAAAGRAAGESDRNRLQQGAVDVLKRNLKARDEERRTAPEEGRRTGPDRGRRTTPEEPRRRTPGGGRGEVIKVGFAGPLSGDLAAYGRSCLDGLEWAVSEYNGDGGLLGRRIEVVAEDDGCDPAKAREAAARLLEEGVGIVFGHACSAATRAALRVYGEKALVISAVATAPGLTDGGDFPLFVRTAVRDDAQAAAQVAHIRRRGYTRVAILNDGSGFGRALARKVRSLIRSDPRGLEIVLYDALDVGSGDEDAEAAVGETAGLVKSKRPQALVWAGYHTNGVPLFTRLRRDGVEAQIVGGDALLHPSFIRLGGRAVEGAIVSEGMASNDPPEARAAIAAFEASSGRKPGRYFIQAAGAAQAVFGAVVRVGDAADPTALRRSLQRYEADTVMGPVRFDSSGDLVNPNVSLYEVRRGEFVKVD